MFKCLILGTLGLAIGACGPKGSPPATGAAGHQAVTGDVTFKGADGFELAGTFEAPAASKPCPAVLLLPGSGPTDRDGNTKLLPVKIDVLKQIADRLAQVGIASLRFDKRAIARYQSEWPKSPDALNHFFSWRHFVEDAEGALTYLRSRPDVDPNRVAMVGHSEGALITLQAASELAKPPVAVVLIGCTGRPMGPVIHDQIARQLTHAPQLDPKIYLAYVDAACAALAAGKPLPPNPPTGLQALFNSTVLDIMGAYCRLDPCAVAAKVKGPALVINGQDDTQVSPVKDTKPLVAALEARSSGTVDVLIVPGASHNLKSTKTEGPDAMSGPVDPRALDRIATWLVKALAAG